jgi:hypothetical protein
MRLLLKRFLAMLCVLAFVSSGTTSVAAASPPDSCAHEHSHGAGAKPHDHAHHGPGCLTCCLGGCTAVPALPGPLTSVPVTFAVTAAVYWEAVASLDSRSIAPDPGPPRSLS